MTRIWRPFSDRDYRRPWRVIPLVKQIGRDIKWAHQRIWRGYCDHDIFSIDCWFTDVMGRMLEQFRKIHDSYPVAPGYEPHALMLDDKDENDAMSKAWDDTLARMVYLLKEMDEETCSQQNQYADEHFDAWLKCQEKEKSSDGERITKCVTLDEFPEYAELDKKYTDEEHRIREYRQKCKDEFFELFSKHFHDLWN